MNALPASSSPEFISPVAPKLVQFLAQKHAMATAIERRVARCASWIAFSTLAYRQKILLSRWELCTITLLEGALNRSRIARIV